MGIFYPGNILDIDGRAVVHAYNSIGNGLEGLVLAHGPHQVLGISPGHVPG